MTRRPFYRWFASAVVAAILAPLTGWSESKPEHVVLQLPYTHQFQFAGVYAAISQGYFKEHNLDVELRTGTATRWSGREVESGRAQYGLGASGILSDRLNGSPFVALAAIFQHSPFVLMSRLSGGISTPSDLIGKRVALAPEGPQHRAAGNAAGRGLEGRAVHHRAGPVGARRAGHGGGRHGCRLPGGRAVRGGAARNSRSSSCGRPTTASISTETFCSPAKPRCARIRNARRPCGRRFCAAGNTRSPIARR
ncbi:MAG: ABC transporter substrate-binding protein [Lacunisphaera sp.]